MKKEFGRLPDGRTAYLYSICGGGLEAHITDLGATLHRLYVPDKDGVPPLLRRLQCGSSYRGRLYSEP